MNAQPITYDVTVSRQGALVATIRLTAAYAACLAAERKCKARSRRVQIKDGPNSVRTFVWTGLETMARRAVNVD